MSVQTYADLQAAVGRWLARSDLSANIPDFIDLFERSANRRLKVRQMETLVSLTPGPITIDRAGVPLPVDYIETRTVVWAGASNPTTGTGTNLILEYVKPEYMIFRFPIINNSVGVPQIYTIEDGNLLVPTMSVTPIELTYVAKIPALGAPGGPGTNWLLTEYWDCYLWGALAEAQGFMIDPEKLALWKMRRDEAFDEITSVSSRSRANGGMRVMGPTP